VSVLQFLPSLSDRDAAETIRRLIDFKYALRLDLDDPGFHHSVLSDAVRTFRVIRGLAAGQSVQQLISMPSSTGNATLT